MSEKSFLKGTLILISANAVSKILGAVFKIPLAHLLKEDGMAVFNTAFSVYSMLLSMVTAGFPIAISNIISKNYALKNYQRIKRISKTASAVLALSGFLISAVMLFGARFFAYSMKDPNAVNAIRILSPSIFAVALSTVFKSFFQGSVDMLPIAVSQITESVIRLCAGLYLAKMFLTGGSSAAASGALLGITLGEFYSTLLLFFIYRRKKFPNLGDASIGGSASREILSLAAPMLLCGLIINALNMTDTSIVRSALLKIRFSEESAAAFTAYYGRFTSVFNNIPQSLKMSIDGARWLYGSYSGYALTVFNFPVGIAAALGSGILPVISGKSAVNDTEGIFNSSASALTFCAVIALPSALVLLLFPEDILCLLFGTSAAARPLRILAPGLFFLCIQQIFSTLLYASGSVVLPSLISGICVVIKAAAAYILIPIPEINILGAPISASISFFISLCLFSTAVKRRMRLKLRIRDIFLKPAMCSALMLSSMLLSAEPLKVFAGNTTGFVLCAVFGIFVYLLSLLLSGVLKRR